MLLFNHSVTSNSVTQWTAACQASPSFIISWSLLKLMSIESIMLSSHLCHPLLLLPSIFPSIRIFANESVVHIRWPKYWSCRLRKTFYFFSLTLLLNRSSKPLPGLALRVCVSCAVASGPVLRRALSLV